MSKKIIGLILLCAVIFSGCAKERKTDDKPADVEKNSEYEVDSLFDAQGGILGNLNIMFGFNNDNSDVFENENNVINTSVNYKVLGADKMDMGLMIFADGILQPVSVAGGEEKKYNIVDVGSNTDIDIKYELAAGIKGENVRINNVTFLHPSFKPTEKTNSFGHSLGGSQTSPYTTICSETVIPEPGSSESETMELSEEIKSTHIFKNSDGTERNTLLTSMGGEYYQNNEKVQKLNLQNGKLSFELHLYGGEFLNYNIYVFYNNNVIKGFSGKEYNTVKVTPDKVTKMKVEADVSSITDGEYNQMFVVAVPTAEEDKSACPYTLDNKIVINR